MKNKLTSAEAINEEMDNVEIDRTRVRDLEMILNKLVLIIIGG